MWDAALGGIWLRLRRWGTTASELTEHLNLSNSLRSYIQSLVGALHTEHCLTARYPLAVVSMVYCVQQCSCICPLINWSYRQHSLEIALKSLVAYCIPFQAND